MRQRQTDRGKSTGEEQTAPRLGSLLLTRLKRVQPDEVTGYGMDSGSNPAACGGVFSARSLTGRMPLPLCLNQPPLAVGNIFSRFAIILVLFTVWWEVAKDEGEGAGLYTRA